MISFIFSCPDEKWLLWSVRLLKKTMGLEGQWLATETIEERLINAFGCAKVVARSPRQAANQGFQPDFAVSGPLQGRFGGCRADLSSCLQPPSHQEKVPYA